MSDVRRREAACFTKFLSSLSERAYIINILKERVQYYDVKFCTTNLHHATNSSTVLSDLLRLHL
jgi:hypothetical protein